MNKKFTFTLFTTLILSSMMGQKSAIAAEYISHQLITQAVDKFLMAKASEQGFIDTKTTIGTIDPRLKLGSCDKDLQVELGNSSLPGNVNVAVSCQGTTPWKIYTQAKVRAFKKILLAKNTIPRGIAFSAKNIKSERREITSLNGNYLTDIEQISGFVAKRNIRPNEILKPRQVVKSKLVKRGELVTIIAETGGISVHMSGKALGDATEGQNVKVKNSNSKRIVEGVAVRHGIVKVKM